MNKRLAPGLFDDNSQGTESPQTYHSPALPSLTSQVGKMELQKLTDEMSAIKAKIRSYENQLDVFKNQISDVLRSIDQRFDRLSQALSRIEKSVHNNERSTEQKIQVFREKLQSANLEEAKVEGLIERQTLVIRNFENRLSAMQQLINEKELLLMKYADAIKRAQPHTHASPAKLRK
ncbi:MAG: hypothetical protein H6623_04585 [Bdellovibrionaceae bacterium]|nr:hypothetical protein [Pseudobdellovibrionaceae bacterium]